jgi:phospholipid-binding lipoprotein MlaA
MFPCRPVKPFWVIAASCLVLAGCAGNPPAANTTQASPDDPWEPLNRRIFEGNRRLDRYTLKPIARGYRKVLPGAVRAGIDNFFVNLRGPWHSINNLLQGDGMEGLHEAGRFLVNSTVGIGGLFDVATEMGLGQHKEDFGQTLAAWGVPKGPYVVIPFFGPSTLRDGLALPLDFTADPLYWYDNSSVRDKLYILRIINLRERYLDAEGLLDDSFDPYIRLREAYLQNRRFQVYDGEPPMEDDFYEEFEEDLE